MDTSTYFMFTQLFHLLKVSQNFSEFQVLWSKCWAFQNLENFQNRAIIRWVIQVWSSLVLMRVVKELQNLKTSKVDQLHTGIIQRKIARFWKFLKLWRARSLICKWWNFENFRLTLRGRKSRVYSTWSIQRCPSSQSKVFTYRMGCPYINSLSIF